MAKTIGELLVDSLVQAGVGQVFGVVGDALNPFTDAIRREERVRWLGVRHEEGAALAAAGQAKVSGRLGVCAGTTDSMCSVDLGRTTEAGAVFRPLRWLALQIRGRGTVTGADVHCSRSCSAQRVEGARVALRARAARGWRFGRWNGGCRGTRPVCTLRLGSGGATATAVFTRLR